MWWGSFHRRGAETQRGAQRFLKIKYGESAEGAETLFALSRRERPQDDRELGM